MNAPDAAQIPLEELTRRRNLASARRQRESDRKALISDFAETMAQAAKLRSWIDAYDRPENQAYPEVQRMLAWAQSELRALDASCATETLYMTLREKYLFPEVDHLADPLGEPPPRLTFGR